MTMPVLLNLWGCNTWETENDLEAASAVAEGGPNWELTADEMIAEVETSLESDAYNTSEPGSPLSVDEWYDSLTQDWPEVAPVIDQGLLIKKHNAEADAYWEKEWKKENKDPPDTIQCFDYAHYQITVAGFRTTDRPPASTAYQVYRDDTGININETVEGVQYLKQAMAESTPVVVGLQLTNLNSRPNPDGTTNHYVAIVSMGQDQVGHYFFYYDSLETRDSGKFYLKPNLVFEDEFGYRKVAQIRQSRAR